MQNVSVCPISFCDVLNAPNAIELLAQYAGECSIPEIGIINPQQAIYRVLEDKGAMQCFGAFSDEGMIGFANVLTTVLPHYGEKVATLESLFVMLEHRDSGAGSELMKAVEEYSKESGCVGILYSAPAGGKLEALLELRRKYRRTNSVFFASLT